MLVNSPSSPTTGQCAYREASEQDRTPSWGLHLPVSLSEAIDLTEYKQNTYNGVGNTDPVDTCGIYRFVEAKKVDEVGAE